MAAIVSISNGEAMSSVRTKLNSVITEINILDPIDWTDYSATSTIVGWSSFTAKKIQYKVIGKQVFVMFQLDGTSNSTATSFTLPYTAISYSANYVVANDNGVSNIGYCVMGTSTVTFSRFSAITTATNLWTATGTKVVRGQFFFDIA